MKQTLQRSLWASSIAIAFFASGTAHATNGYFAHGYGTQTKGLAGAGVAHPKDSLAAATNPAGMVMVGDRLDVGLAWFHPEREYTVIGSTPSGFPGTVPLSPTTTQSDSNDFFIPHFGYNKMLTPDMSVGVSVYGNGGMNTDYPAFSNPLFCFDPVALVPVGSQSGPFCFGGAGINLEQLFIAPTFAHKFALASGHFAWGISPIFAYQRFKADGITAFSNFSSDPTKLTDKGTDTSSGFGVKVGISADVTPNLTLAASYQSKMEMSEFDDYKGLFAEQGDFDIPSTWTVGLSWMPAPNHSVVFDVQQIDYTDVDSVANSITNLTQLGQPFGTTNGPGFGWDDITVVKLGYEFSVASLPDWTWRVGYSHTAQPIPDQEVTLNIFAPATIDDHVTFGFTKQQGSNFEWSLAAMHALHNTVKGDHAFEAPGVQQVQLEMDQFEVEASFGWKF